MPGHGPLQFTPPIDEVRQELRMSPKAKEAALALSEALSKQPAPPVAEPMPLPSWGDPPEGEPTAKKEADEERIDVSPRSVLSGSSYLDNPRVRKAIETRCSELDFSSLVTTGRVQQKVSIRPKSLEVVFQTISGEDELFINEQAHEESMGGPNLLKTYAIMELTLGIHSINGKTLPNHLGEKGERDPKLFKERWKRVASFSVELLQLLMLNHVWFRERVSRLTVLDDLGNG